MSGQRVQDFSLYSGTLGTALLLFKSFQVTHNKNDLNLCLEIVKACDSSSTQSRSSVLFFMEIKVPIDSQMKCSFYVLFLS